MVGAPSGWKVELGRFLKPFLDRLGHRARRQMCPLYVSGLIGPGDRKSIQPMAKRLALGEYDQLHHFIAAGVWDATPVETELLVQADRLIGSRSRHLLRGPACRRVASTCATLASCPYRSCNRTPRQSCAACRDPWSGGGRSRFWERYLGRNNMVR